VCRGLARKTQEQYVCVYLGPSGESPCVAWWGGSVKIPIPSPQSVSLVARGLPPQRPWKEACGSHKARERRSQRPRPLKGVGGLLPSHPGASALSPASVSPPALRLSDCCLTVSHLCGQLHELQPACRVVYMWVCLSVRPPQAFRDASALLCRGVCFA
jgi:hypothetical protein